MGAVPYPIRTIGAFHERHYQVRDFTGSAKCPPERQTSSHWPIDTLCMSVAIILCNKMDIIFCMKVEGFRRAGHTRMYVYKN